MLPFGLPAADVAAASTARLLRFVSFMIIFIFSFLFFSFCKHFVHFMVAVAMDPPSFAGFTYRSVRCTTAMTTNGKRQWPLPAAAAKARERHCRLSSTLSACVRVQECDCIGIGVCVGALACACICQLPLPLTHTQTACSQRHQQPPLSHLCACSHVVYLCATLLLFSLFSCFCRCCCFVLVL